MTENTDYQPHPLTEILLHLSPAEQLRVITTHPFFTGRCPQCRYQLPLIHSTSAHCNCLECGWVDDLGNFPPEATAANNSPVTDHTNVKRLGSYLVEAGLLTQAQVDAALSDQIGSKLRLGEVLAKLGLINQQTVEYLMKKVILPERVAAQRESLSYPKSVHS